MDLPQSVLRPLQGDNATYIRFDPPVPVEFFEPRVFVEETAVPSAHMAIANHPSFAHSNRTQVLETVHESALIDPVWKGPVFKWDDFVVAFGGGEVLCCLLGEY